MNLFLALFWFVLGMAIFVYQWMTGEDRLVIGAMGDRSIRLAIPQLGGLSVGWLMMMICLFNVARWWLLLAAKRERQARFIPDPPVRRRSEPNPGDSPSAISSSVPPQRPNRPPEPPSPN
jgi:hypothetical protein